MGLLDLIQQSNGLPGLLNGAPLSSPGAAMQPQAPMSMAGPMMPQQTNLPQADAAMNLSPQEQALYMRHIANLYGPGAVDNPDGSRSTLYQSVEPHDGQFYNIPTVWDGKREVQPYTRADGSVMDVANPTALNNVAKAGWNTFPAYPSPDVADARYEQMHRFLEQDTANYMKNRR